MCNVKYFGVFVPGEKFVFGFSLSENIWAIFYCRKLINIVLLQSIQKCQLPRNAKKVEMQ